MASLIQGSGLEERGRGSTSHSARLSLLLRGSPSRPSGISGMGHMCVPTALLIMESASHREIIKCAEREGGERECGFDA